MKCLWVLLCLGVSFCSVTASETPDNGEGWVVVAPSSRDDGSCKTEELARVLNLLGAIGSTGLRRNEEILKDLDNGLAELRHDLALGQRELREAHRIKQGLPVQEQPIVKLQKEVIEDERGFPKGD